MKGKNGIIGGGAGKVFIREEKYLSLLSSKQCLECVCGYECIKGYCLCVVCICVSTKCTPLYFFLSFLLYGQNGSNALHLAACGGHVDIVKYLKFGDRLFHLDNYGNTCLHYALLQGHLAVVKYLVEECGFDPNLGNQVTC